MSADPLSPRVLAAAAVLAVVVGVGVAYCDHQDDPAPPATDACADVAYVTGGGRPRPPAPARPAPRQPAHPPKSLRKAPPLAGPSTPTVRPSRTGRPHHRHDIELDLDGC
ncbi:hypothetical protein [Streptomyces sp. NBC_00425]|uniref:hypothetical protein n=1 Tax=Streptomyces sp. NBC_00425 TaxID=2975740 RepID=UPI002E222D12